MAADGVRARAAIEALGRRIAEHRAARGAPPDAGDLDALVAGACEEAGAAVDEVAAAVRADPELRDLQAQTIREALALGAAAAAPPEALVGPDGEQLTPPPNANERARLDVQRRVAAKLVAALPGGAPAALGRTRADLLLIQRVLDEGLAGADKPYELQCLGAALGDVLARELGLRWVIAEDSSGRDAALRWRETSLVVFPLTMILKRVERGERVDVEYLFEQTKQVIDGLGGGR